MNGPLPAELNFRENTAPIFIFMQMILIAT